ncbi:MAG: hypothetical protein AAFU59_16690 [Pseudomonadota bacterium]
MSSSAKKPPSVRATLRLTDDEIAALPPGRTTPERIYQAIKLGHDLANPSSAEELSEAYREQLSDFKEAHVLLHALVESLVPIVQDVVDRRLVDRSDALHAAMLGVIEGLAEMASAQANNNARTAVIYRALINQDVRSGNEARHLRDQIAVHEGGRIYAKFAQILDTFAIAEGQGQRSGLVRTPGNFDGPND